MAPVMVIMTADRRRLRLDDARLRCRDVRVRSRSATVRRCLGGRPGEDGAGYSALSAFVHAGQVGR